MAGEIVFEGGAVIAHNYIDGLVIFLNERERGIALLTSGAYDGNRWGRFQSFARFQCFKVKFKEDYNNYDLKRVADVVSN